MMKKRIYPLIIALCGLLLAFSLPSVIAQKEKAPVDVDGPYQVGTRIIKITDASRDNRTLQAFIFYPAEVKKDAPRPYAPDSSGRPYPLVIYSHGYQGSTTEASNIFINRLVSQGFVVAAVDHQDTDDVPFTLINRPLDVLFLLNSLADLKDDPLSGVIDTDNVGVAGFSFGGYATLALSGAQATPSHFKDWCGTAEGAQYVSCNLQASWDKFLAYHQQLDPPSEGDTWAAHSDPRIHAIFAIAPCLGQLYEPQGLAGVTIPAFIVAGTGDKTCRYADDAAYYYPNFGKADHYLVSIDKLDHLPTLRKADVVGHYAAAFFGRYLLGKTDYSDYLTPDPAKAFRNTTLEATLASD